VLQAFIIQDVRSGKSCVSVCPRAGMEAPAQCVQLRIPYGMSMLDVECSSVLRCGVCRVGAL
jgi:hypothetical protein